MDIGCKNVKIIGKIVVKMSNMVNNIVVKMLNCHGEIYV